jgi:NitT/TauT family transport system ATP-binding protein
MSSPATAPLIELHDVSKTFAAGTVAVLKDISFELRPGEIVALLGRSGCGKSTLLRIVCGVSAPSVGRVVYRGKPVKRAVAGISLVFQNFALFPWLNVLENVELGLEAQGVPPAERRQRALALIDMIGLDGFESAYPRELSGGMRQRVGLARALVVNPDVLLMDEAFSALDVPTAEALRGDLLDLWIERLIPTQAILMVSHSIEEALLMADRLILLDNNPGRVKAEVAVQLKHPRDRQSPVFRQLLDHVYNLLTAAAATGVPMPFAPVWIEIGHQLPNVTVGQFTGVIEEIMRPPAAGTIQIPDLSEATQMEADELLPVLEALQVLDFIRVNGVNITVTPHGRAFAEADIQRRKMIFGEHLLKRVPLATHIRRVLDERPSQSAPESRFLRELEDYLNEEEAQRVLSVIIDWGRYAELFAYDYNSGVFSTENPGEETTAA